MSIVTLQEAQQALPSYLEAMSPGAELLITDEKGSVARLTIETKRSDATDRKLGTLKGSVSYMSPDFNAPLEDFREYSE